MLIKIFILLTIVLFMSSFSGCSLENRVGISSEQTCRQYQIIKDDLGIFIEVAVDEILTTEQLKCVLVEVADRHQNDKSRDYLWSDYLWVEIYLRNKDAAISQNPCGKLRRSVALNKSKDTITTKNNSFYFSLENCVSE